MVTFYKQLWFRNI